MADVTLGPKRGRLELRPEVFPGLSPPSGRNPNFPLLSIECKICQAATPPNQTPT
jgi:hypothetical protein